MGSGAYFEGIDLCLLARALQVFISQFIDITLEINISTLVLKVQRKV